MSKWFEEVRPHKGVRCFIRRRGNWLIDWFFSTILAVTLGDCIYFRSYRAYRKRWLRDHEYRHVEQGRKVRFFLLRYMFATLWYGYRNNPYEVEAEVAEMFPDLR